VLLKEREQAVVSLIFEARRITLGGPLLLENDTAAVHEMGVVAAEQSEHTIALAGSQSEAAASVRESLVSTFDSLAVDAPTGGTPARMTAGTLMATPVARTDIAAMRVERGAALATFRSGLSASETPWPPRTDCLGFRIRGVGAHIRAPEQSTPPAACLFPVAVLALC
jgi:hypothetical protein